MIKKIFITLTVVTLILMNSNMLLAEDSWKMAVIANINDAENKLIIGLASDASDGIDGRHDVPALLTGDIKAYMDLEGLQYWKDIRETCEMPCNKVWNIIVESEAIGQPVKLRWDSTDITDNIEILITDTATGEIIDMKSVQGIVYENAGEREFIIEAKTNGRLSKKELRRYLQKPKQK